MEESGFSCKNTLAVWGKVTYTECYELTVSSGQMFSK